jgi:hypothetical protein
MLFVKMWVQKNTPRQDEGGILTGSKFIISANQLLSLPQMAEVYIP